VVSMTAVGLGPVLQAVVVMAKRMMKSNEVRRLNMLN